MSDPGSTVRHHTISTSPTSVSFAHASFGCGGLKAFARRHQRPDDPGHLVRQGNSDEVVRLLRQKLSGPACRRRFGLAAEAEDRMRPDDEKPAEKGSPCLLILPRRSLPPDESRRCTRPIHAANCRPDPKSDASVTVAAIALAVIGQCQGSSRGVGSVHLIDANHESGDPYR